MEELDLDDDPELVGIEVYVTSARRAYALADRYRARGAHVVLGGLHVTSCPDEAARHADSIVLGPGEEAWPRLLADFRAGRPRAVYRSESRTLSGLPRVRRDLIRRELYLVPNSLVVSRGCPHTCGFCYKDAFFSGGRSFYVQPVDEALAEIERLPGRHLYFLDDHLFGHPAFAEALFQGMRGMGRLWQAAGTVDAVLGPGLIEKAVACGLRSLFVGFETLGAEGLRAQRQAAEPRERLRRGGPPPARPRRHGQRQLRLRLRRGRHLGLRADGGVGDPARGRNRDLPRPHALPWHGALPEDGGLRAPPAPRLGPLRHAPRGLPPRAHDAASSSRRATGAPTATSTAGARSCEGPPPSPTSPAGSGTPPTPSAGRSASRSGTASSAPGASDGPCRCSSASSRGPGPHPPAEGPRRTCYRPVDQAR